MKRSRYLFILLILFCVVSADVTYSRFTFKKTYSGTVTVPEDNFCINNGFNKLGECMLLMDSATDNIDSAISTIKGRQADFNKSEPEIIYRKKETLGLSSSSIVSTTSAVYYTEEEPTLNTATGYYTWPSNTGKLDFLTNIISNDSKKYYTCMNQTSNGNCTNVYVIYAVNTTTSNGVTTYKVTSADRYSQEVSDTASASPGLYFAEDDYGDSYYYRGNVKNNYVSYAGYIWRIIRQNGDGSIRMIYSGTSTSATGSNTSIRGVEGVSSSGTAAFNTQRQDMAFVGYKYGLKQVLKHTTATLTYSNIAAGTKYYFSDSYSCENNSCVLNGNLINGTWIDTYSKVLNGDDNASNYKYTCFSTTASATCPIVSEITNTVTTNGTVNPTQARVKYHGYLSESYQSMIEDDNDSNIKKVVDRWYSANLLDKKDAQGNTYGSYLADALFCNDRSIASNSGNKDGSTLEATTLYGPYERVYSKKTPSLKCPNQADSLTVASGKLTYPIGLITLDEVSMAGGKYANMNSLYYLYTGQTYWTLSPSSFSSNNASAYVWYVISTGTLNNYWATAASGVRPVVNLASDILITGGTGTANNPYIVSR